MLTSFVTGASGHLGANLVRVLLERGERVRVLMRPGGDDVAVRGLPVEIVRGDLSDAIRLADQLRGCARLYHLAALVSIRSIDRARLHETNVVGTRRILAAAERAGVERVVHCSSFGAVGTRAGGTSDESTYLLPHEPAMDYDRTKAAAEAECMRAVARGLDVRVVCPSGLLGPWDFKPSLIGRTMLDFARGRMHAYVPGGHDFVPVRDVALGHVLAMERGERGRRYLLTGAHTTVDELFAWMAEATGRSPPRVRIPARAILPIAAIKDGVERRFFPRRSPRFNEHSIRILSSAKRADGSWTRAALGWTPTANKDAVAEQLEWFRVHGWL